MSEWQPIETAPTNGQPNPAALLSAMQILPLADACALVAMSPEHRATCSTEARANQRDRERSRRRMMARWSVSDIDAPH